MKLPEGTFGGQWLTPKGAKRVATPTHCHALHAARSIESIEGGVGLMMVGVAPPMATNPPDGVMALPAGGLHTKAAPRASPATHGAPKAPIGTHPTPHPTPRGATRTPIWPWPRRMWGSGAEKTLETLCYKWPNLAGNGRVWHLVPYSTYASPYYSC